MTKLSLSFLVESDKTFTFFLDGKRQPLLSPLHQGFLLPGSMVMIPSFFKEFGEPPYQRPHCPPHLLYCILSIFTPPSSVRLFIKIGPWKFSMFTLSVTCLWRGVRSDAQLRPTETRFQKCSQSGKNGSKHPMLSISMAFNMISCKKV